jgi:hypothetical protein
MSTIALAAIILDSLNSRFALSWRRTLTSTLQVADNDLKRETPSIDTLRPELLPLSALIIADKFLDDHEDNTSYYAKCWGSAMWTTEQINLAQKTIFENLNWRIKPMCEEGLIKEAKDAMMRAGKHAFPMKPEIQGDENLRKGESFSHVVNLGEGGFKQSGVEIETVELVSVS